MRAWRRCRTRKGCTAGTTSSTKCGRKGELELVESGLTAEEKLIDFGPSSEGKLAGCGQEGEQTLVDSRLRPAGASGVKQTQGQEIFEPARDANVASDTKKTTFPCWSRSSRVVMLLDQREQRAQKRRYRWTLIARRRQESARLELKGCTFRPRLKKQAEPAYSIGATRSEGEGSRDSWPCR